MRLLIITLLTALLFAGTATAADRDHPYRPDELGWDDGTFEGFGTADDWGDMAVGLFSPGGDCSAFLTTLRLYGWADGPREVFMDTNAAWDTPPTGLRGTGIFFDPGTSGPDEAGWIEIDLTGLLVYIFPTQVLAIGVSLEGDAGLAFDDSCGAGDCGHYWTRRDGLWEEASAFGHNLGVRVILPGTCHPTREGTISAIKSLYR